MCASKSKGSLRNLLLHVAAVCALASSCAYAEGGSERATVHATLPAAQWQLSDFEHVFWICDYQATLRGVEATPVALCSAVTDEVKNQKFGGDFELLLAWWRLNKPAEHEKLSGF